MNRYVYMFNTYEESGPEDMVATLDRSNCMEIMKNNYSWVGEYEMKSLTELLERDDDDLASVTGGYAYTHNLSHGWGGIQFSVVRIQ